MAAQRETIERALKVVERGQIPGSVLTHFGKLQKVKARTKPVTRQALSTMEEPLSFSHSASSAKVQPRYVTLGCSNGPPGLSMRNVGRSGGVYQPDFLRTLHEVIVCASPQKIVVACKQSEKRWNLLQVLMATMPSRDVELLEER